MSSKIEYIIEGLTLSVDAPELKGSEKQIAWARDIRRKKVIGVFDEMTNSPARLDGAKKHPEQLSFYLDVIQGIVTSRTNAKDWIDNRNEVFHDVIGAAIADRGSR